MVTRRLLIVTAIAVVVLTAACSASAPARHAAERPVDRTSPAVKPRRAVARSEEVTLAFVGDVHFAGRVARLLKDPSTAFGPITSVLRSADFTGVSLETPVTNRGRPQPKTYHFATTPAAFTALRDAGVDLVTITNNHILDFGQAGLADTLAAAKAAQFPYVGAGVNAAAAWAPYVTTINGTKIAIVGVSQVAELASSWVATAHRPGEANTINLGRTLSAVRAAKRLARIVIVFMHWGTEGTACRTTTSCLWRRSWPPRGRASSSAPTRTCSRAQAGSANVRRLRHGQLPVVGALLQHRDRGAEAHPAPARAADRAVPPRGRLEHCQPIEDQGAAARRALAHYGRLRTCAGLSASPPARAITPTSAG